MPTIERTLTTSAGIDEVGVDSDLTTAEQSDPPTVSTVRTTDDGGVAAPGCRPPEDP